MAKIHYVDHKGETRAVEVENGATVMEGAIRNAIPGIEAECGGPVPARPAMSMWTRPGARRPARPRRWKRTCWTSVSTCGRTLPVLPDQGERRTRRPHCLDAGTAGVSQRVKLAVRIRGCRQHVIDGVDDAVRRIFRARLERCPRFSHRRCAAARPTLPGDIATPCAARRRDGQIPRGPFAEMRRRRQCCRRRRRREITPSQICARRKSSTTGVHIGMPWKTANGRPRRTPPRR